MIHNLTAQNIKLKTISANTNEGWNKQNWRVKRIAIVAFWKIVSLANLLSSILLFDKMREKHIFVWHARGCDFVIYKVTSSLKARKNGQKKRTTCLATLLKNELNSDVLPVLPPAFKPVNNLICCKTGLTWVVKRATSLFNSFYSNVARQVVRFLLPVFPYLNVRLKSEKGRVVWNLFKTN